MNIHRGAERKADREEAKQRKREGKKTEIANSAISALKVFGYAQTTLRDIADQSDMSLGMMHYYFDSKEELLIYCVRLYKEEFVANLQAAVAGASPQEGPAEAFVSALIQTIEQDSEIHRLWYDIRSQSMFDPSFKPVVSDLEASMAGLMKDFCTDPDDADEVHLLYAQIDGVFRFILQQSLFGAPLSPEKMRKMFMGALR